MKNERRVGHGRLEAAGACSGGRSERALELLLACCGLLTLLTTIAILGVLAAESLVFFRELGAFRLLVDTQRTPLFADEHLGMRPWLAGTLLTSSIALAVAVPLGLLSAIFMSELTHPRHRALLKPALEVLAGIPTIVYGCFALIVVMPALHAVVPALSGFNAVSAGLVMGIMVTPTIASLADDALRAVPRRLREAAYALGATRIATIWRVVVPAAFSGIGGSTLLALSRTVGEIVIVAIAAGRELRSMLDPRAPIDAVTAYIMQVSTRDITDGIVVVLFTLLVVNSGAIYLRNRRQKRNAA